MISKKILSYPFSILRATLAEWRADRAPRLAAALAFHALTALAPLLIIAAGVAGFVLGPRDTRAKLAEQVLRYTDSEEIAALVRTILDQTARPAASTLATIVGVMMLLWGASNLFSELKSTLNDIWDVPPQRAGSARRALRTLGNRGVSLLLVLATGLMLLASAVLTPWLAAIAERLGAGALKQAGALAASYLLTLLIFAFIYRYLPDVRLGWRDVGSGAAVTALLFAIGRQLINLYLRFSLRSSAYGAAGSFIVVLLWLYYFAQIFLFGAELSRVVAAMRSSQGHLHADTADAKQTPAEEGVNTPAT